MDGRSVSTHLDDVCGGLVVVRWFAQGADWSQSAVEAVQVAGFLMELAFLVKRVMCADQIQQHLNVHVSHVTHLNQQLCRDYS
ncbi:hypothetical protein OPV22_034566 [Ensete ventricosum]|uniref:Uncharacterized protein n=1 Tax=Ensete ventricosum TaxID=4639 RepID=A0AAV8Q358_ENSVE|nr:hypothetical protein OPV22_034566 [Ensete ventricosum]